MMQINDLLKGQRLRKLTYEHPASIAFYKSLVLFNLAAEISTRATGSGFCA